MSRVAKNPVPIPSGVEVKLDGNQIVVKGQKGVLSQVLCDDVDVKVENGLVFFAARSAAKHARAMSGTLRALVNNMVVGVSKGFERKLLLVGVGYRAQAQGTSLNLALGFSHPIVYQMPVGVSVETPSQTEIVIACANKQVLGQVAADLRSYRPPEPYKGKGVRYLNETVTLKETKKK